MPSLEKVVAKKVDKKEETASNALKQHQIAKERQWEHRYVRKYSPLILLKLLVLVFDLHH